MAKITQYPAKTVPSNNDEFVLHDTASGSTKKMTRGDLIGGAPLPANSVDGQAIADGSVTPAKFNLASGVSLLIDRKYSTGNTNTSGANSFQTIAGASISFTAESGPLPLRTEYPDSECSDPGGCSKCRPPSSTGTLRPFPAPYRSHR